MDFTGGKKSYNMEGRERIPRRVPVLRGLRPGTEERGMDDRRMTDEEQLSEACTQGAKLDGLLEKVSQECDLAGGEDDELRRQEAFVRALLESEEEKTQVREAMELEQEKLRAMIARLEKMEP